MSASGSRATDEINLDEFERRLRAAGAQQAQRRRSARGTVPSGRILAHGDLERRDARRAAPPSPPLRARSL